MLRQLMHRSLNGDISHIHDRAPPGAGWWPFDGDGERFARLRPPAGSQHNATIRRCAPHVIFMWRDPVSSLFSAVLRYKIRPLCLNILRNASRCAQIARRYSYYQPLSKQSQSRTYLRHVVSSLERQGAEAFLKDVASGIHGDVFEYEAMWDAYLAYSALPAHDRQYPLTFLSYSAMLKGDSFLLTAALRALCLPSYATLDHSVRAKDRDKAQHARRSAQYQYNRTLATADDGVLRRSLREGVYARLLLRTQRAPPILHWPSAVSAGVDGYVAWPKGKANFSSEGPAASKRWP